MGLSLDAASFPDALRWHRAHVPAFTVERTGYTAAIKTPNGKKKLFAETPVPLRLFGLFQRLKSEIKRRGIPQLPTDPIKYYNFDRIKELENLPAVAYSVDLSSAYAQALFNLGMIGEEMFQELSQVSKGHRLKVVGMLATQKTVITYGEGRILDVATVTSETRPAFFAACAEVGRLMELSTTAPGFLFYWVDGAFFDTPSEQVSQYFTEQGYPCKTETVHDLKLSPSRKVLFYTKDERRKYLCLPTKRPAAAWITELLNTP
jgi:hypothetical protein